MNRVSHKKKVLIVCTAFAPLNAIGAIRLSKFVKYLVCLGWEATVLTLPVNKDDLCDNTLLSNELNSVNIIRVPYSYFFNKFAHKLNNKVSSGISGRTNNDGKRSTTKNTKTEELKTIHFIKSCGAKFIIYLKHIIWYRECKKQLCRLRLGDRKFNIVFSSFPSIPSHWVAKFARDKKIAEKWVADFRDPMAYKELNSKCEYKRKLRKQKHIVKSADAIIGVSEALADSLREMSVEKGMYKPVFFIPNGYDKDDYQISNTQCKNDSKEPPVLSFSYTGGLYGGKRNLEVIFKIIQELILENVIKEYQIRFNYAGKEFRTLLNQAEKYGLAGILHDFGYVARGESINIQMKSCINVVCTWNNGNYHGVIPGKIYESFLLNKPTIAIINGDASDSEVAKIVRSTNIGVAFEEANFEKGYPELKQYIKACYMNYIENHFISYKPEYTLIEKYDYKNLTEELDKVFLEVMTNE